MDQTTILAVSIAVLSAILVVVGIYSLVVLHDLRQTLRGVNKILGRVDGITEHLDTNIIRPAASIAGILAVLKEGAQVAREVKEIAEEVPQAARVVDESAKEIAEVASDEAKEVLTEAKEDSKEIVQEVSSEAKEAVKETMVEAHRPEPMAAGSLAPRRRFFSRKKS